MAVYMAVYMVRTSVPPLSPFIIEELSLSKTEVGLLISAGALGYSVFQLPAGWLIDRFGVRRMLVVGTFAAGAIILSMLLATPYRSPSRFSSSVASATWRSTTPS